MLSKYFKQKRKSPRLHRVLKKEDAEKHDRHIPEIATDERVREVDHFDRNALHIAVRDRERITMRRRSRWTFFHVCRLTSIIVHSFFIHAVCQPSYDARYYGHSAGDAPRWFVGTR